MPAVSHSPIIGAIGPIGSEVRRGTDRNTTLEAFGAERKTIGNGKQISKHHTTLRWKRMLCNLALPAGTFTQNNKFRVTLIIRIPANRTLEDGTIRAGGFEEPIAAPAIAIFRLHNDIPKS